MRLAGEPGGDAVYTPASPPQLRCHPKLLGTTDGYLPTTEGRLRWQS
jgi:hypothetical protein